MRGVLRPARVAAAGVLVSVAVAACGSSGPAKLDTATVARAIEQRILAQNGIATAVLCAAPPVMRVGATFRCSAKLAVGTYAVDVVAINAKGSFRYSSSGPLQVLDSVTVEHAIAGSIRRQLHLAAAVSCPAPVLQSAGVSFSCLATTKRGTHRFKVTQLDANGKVDIVDLTPKQASTHRKTKTKTKTTTHTKAAHTTHRTTRSHTHTHAATSSHTKTATSSHTRTSTTRSLTRTTSSSRTKTATSSPTRTSTTRSHTTTTSSHTPSSTTHHPRTGAT